MRPVALAVALSLLAGPALASAPIEGIWNTAENGGRVEIYACGDAFCGHIVTSDQIRANPNVTDLKNHDAALRTRPLRGLVILTGFAGGPQEWKGGSLYNPEDGGAYHGSIRLIDPDTLRLEGCIIYPFCKTQMWKRVR